MASSFVDTPFNTIYTAATGTSAGAIAVSSGQTDIAMVQATMVALQSALSVNVPTPSGYYLSGISWIPTGGGTPTGGTLIFQWTHT